MNQKKLIIFMPLIEIGGVKKNLLIIANFLCKKLDKVSLITTSNEYKNKFDPQINVVHPRYFNSNKVAKRVKFLICLYLLIIEIIKDKNVAVLCFQANIYCTLICKLFGIRIIVRSNTSPSGWSKNFIKKILYKKILGFADIVIVNSLEFKKEFKTRFNIKALCIYNPLNCKEIQKLAKIKIKNNFFNTHSLNIINVARLADEKDHLTLLKAINLLKNTIKIKLLIIGDGTNKDKIIRFIKLNKITKIVKLKSYTNNPYPFIKVADLFVLSSTFEGLPNVLLESLCLNTFVISSNCPTGPKEILNNNKGGLLFKSGDHVELSKQILFFINNKNICAQKKIYAKLNLKRFDYEINLNNYLKIIKKYLVTK
jgi:glycosyltransferase involved in cell wall biosynthesis